MHSATFGLTFGRARAALFSDGEVHAPPRPPRKDRFFLHFVSRLLPKRRRVHHAGQILLRRAGEPCARFLRGRYHMAHVCRHQGRRLALQYLAAMVHLGTRPIFRAVVSHLHTYPRSSRWAW